MKKALFASLFFLYSCSEPVFEYVPLAQAETKLISIEKFNKDQSPKNIILLIGDGTGLTGVASTDNIITSTASTFANINSTGIISATSFEGNFILDSYLFN